MDIVQTFHKVHGHCPGRQWTEYIDIVQSEWAPWTLSRVSMDCPDFPLIPWTMSRESMNIVQGAHVFSGNFTDGFLSTYLKEKGGCLKNVNLVENSRSCFLDGLGVCEAQRHKPYEPRYEKTGFLHMRKQRRRSALR